MWGEAGEARGEMLVAEEDWPPPAPGPKGVGGLATVANIVGVNSH